MKNFKDLFMESVLRTPPYAMATAQEAGEGIFKTGAKRGFGEGCVVTKVDDDYVYYNKPGVPGKTFRTSRKNYDLYIANSTAND